MYYSDDLVEEVRSRSDIVDVISGYVRLTKRGGTYFGLCPFHNEKTPSFSVTPSKQMYYCFGCGAGGNVFTFLMNYENVTFPEAMKTLADRAGIQLPEQELSEQEKRQASLKKTLLDIHKEAGRYYYYQLKSKQGEAAYAYLTGRGLTDETIRHFGLGYSSMYQDDLYRYLRSRGFHDSAIAQSGLVRIEERGCHDKFWNRVMYPIMDVNSRIIGFGGRVMGQGEPKYLNSPETMLFDKSRNLYGLNFAKASRKDFFICCEGYMDVIAMHQAGFTNAVASLGTAFTPQQATLLKRYTSQVVLAYDSDGAGVKAAMRAIPILRNAGISVRVLNMRPHKDPDEFMKALGAEEFEKRIQNAENFFLYQTAVLSRNYNMEDPEQKTAFYRETAKSLLEFPEELERNNYLEAVSDRFLIPKDSLKKLVSQMSRQVGLVKKEDEPVRMPAEPDQAGAKKEKDDGNKRAQRMLLTILVGDKRAYPKIRELIGPDDFTEKLYREVAEEVFSMLAEDKMNPAAILSHFINDEEEYREVARMFNASLPGGLSEEEQDKAFTETVRRVKKNSLAQKGRQVQSFDELQKIVRAQKELDGLTLRLS